MDRPATWPRPAGRPPEPRAPAVTRTRLYTSLGGAIALSVGCAFGLVEQHSAAEEKTRQAEFGTDRVMIDALHDELLRVRETLDKGFDELRADVKTLLSR